MANTQGVWNFGRYGVSRKLDTAYQGFLGVGTTFNIFQNILFLYLGYGVWMSPGYDVLDFDSSWFLVKCRVVSPVCYERFGFNTLFFGIKVASSPKGYLLSQSKYIADLLDRPRITDKMVKDIPIDGKAKYTPTDGGPLPDPSLYRTIVGSVVYLTVTRPDIVYVVHIVSQFITAPTIVYWDDVLQILRYLRGTQFKTLLFPSTSSLDLRAYCDADWAGDSVTRKSTIEFFIFVGYLSWKSKKQDVLSRSSTETEYRAMVVTTSEIVWLRWLLADMGVRITSSTSLYYDNHSAIQIAHDTIFHERTKHIEIDCHFTRSLEDISSSKKLKTQVFYTLRKKKIKEDNTKSKNQAKYAALQDKVNEGRELFWVLWFGDIQVRLMTYPSLWLEGLLVELEWDPLPNYTMGSSNSFEWRKIIFGMITSKGIRHTKTYTLRGRSSTKLGQRYG
nr:uncharacterized mitochondrial protein AtMg00810-like [Tanacetum cinerariifolium]